MNDRDRRWINLRERHRKQAAQDDAFRATLETANGIAGHPKADRLWQLAWDMGHSAGYSEIEICYNEMADLLKPAGKEN